MHRYNVDDKSALQRLGIDKKNIKRTKRGTEKTAVMMRRNLMNHE